MDASRMDAINRRAWSSRAAVRWFASLEGWTDPGERAAIERVRDEAMGEPILDIGVGGGRTVPLLRAISADYVGVDYTQRLVDACRKRHPGARILLADARDLAMFESESFALAVFSFNGIDAVNADDRLTILREVRRVLRPGGAFVFSTHNRRGPGHHEPLRLGFYPSHNPLKVAARLVRSLVEAPLAVLNHRRYSKLNEEDDDHSIMNAAAHAHGIVIHYITLEAQRAQLVDAGFEPGAEAYDSVDGLPLCDGDDTSRAWWFHFVAWAGGDGA